MAETSPIVSGLAGRYAHALFELAREAGTMDAVGADLQRFGGLISASADLALLIKNPVFSAQEQVGALKAVLEKAGISGLAANFILLVAEKRRLFALSGMISGFQALLAEAKGIISAEVTVSAPLSEKNRAVLLAALEAQSKKSIALSERVDPAIIGGLVVKMGSRMIDASLRTKLNAMKLMMKHA